jgi:hypothetical protein
MTEELPSPYTNYTYPSKTEQTMETHVLLYCDTVSYYAETVPCDRQTYWLLWAGYEVPRTSRKE